ncbi:MAG TPA: cysteine--tRNA ligase [Proteobacteria bacterium]|nr:cysteine--tRNA ligase [Pseudomonadota bacterium]
MALRLYNSFSGQKEGFKPLVDNQIGIYVCGITAYDDCHLGHARAAVVFDVIIRYLRHRGFKVTHVQNITDIDDKIINRAREKGVSCKELSEHYTGKFHRDMEALGVARPDMEPKATGHIQDIIRLIETLVSKGYAYAAEGNVFFSVEKFPGYGRLSHRSLEEMQAGARVEIDSRKRNPMDFALWKASKPGEPSWESPWGPGRPGWHIECSAMSIRYLGETFDIHGGGQDLIFPHHENEVAQSVAATGKPFVRYFVHNGFVTINGEKMSKSLGNFLTIKEILSGYHPEALRLFLLSKHYRSPLDYSEDLIREKQVSLDRIYTTLSEAMEISATSAPQPDAGISLPPEVEDAYTRIRDLKKLFYEAMDDDFNTAQAMGHVFDAVKGINTLLQISKKGPDQACRAAIGFAVSAIREVGQVLGLFSTDPKSYLEGRRAEKLSKLSLTADQIRDLIHQREEARAKKDWAVADALRKKLAGANIILKDSPQGTTWEIKE